MQKISRTKIELSLECPRCFWLDVVRGVKRPPPAPYTINNAVDYLLKQEFDLYREKQKPHPVMEKFGVDAVPYQTPELDKWRHNFTGVQVSHVPTNLLVYGAVDDVWVNRKGELIVVDYKATGANEHRIYDSYKRQMEVYQWLLAQKGNEVSPVGYFVFARVNKGGGFGDGQAALQFNIFVEPLKGEYDWVEPALRAARALIDTPHAPEASPECVYCAYRDSARKVMHNTLI